MPRSAEAACPRFRELRRDKRIRVFEQDEERRDERSGPHALHVTLELRGARTLESLVVTDSVRQLGASWTPTGCSAGIRVVPAAGRHRRPVRGVFVGVLRDIVKGVFTQLRGVMEFILALNGPRQTRGGSNVHSLPNI